MMKLFAALLLLMLPTLAWAQNVVQGGAITIGHPVRWSAPGVISDGGGAGGSQTQGSGYLTELGITNTGTPLCINDALISAPGGYHQLCIGANALGTGLLSFRASGGAQPIAFDCNINGQFVANCLNGGGAGGIASVPPSNIGDVSCWNNTTASLIKDCSGALTGVLTNNPYDSQVASLAQIAITSDTAVVANPLAFTGIPALALNHLFGGAGTGAGGRQGLWVNLAQVGDMVNPNPVPFHTGIFSNVDMASGTSDGSNVYAYAAQLSDQVGGHYIITGGEIDLASNAPGNFRMEGWSVAIAPLAGGHNLFPPITYNAGYGVWVSGACGTGSLSGGSGCNGFAKGISFGRDDSYWPVGNDGTIIGVTKGVSTNMNADWGIRFVDDDGVTPVSFKFCAFRSAGVCIDGTGNYKLVTPFPTISMQDTSISSPATNGGLIRFTSNGGSPEAWQFQINTAPAGDFSTSIVPIGFSQAGTSINGLIITQFTPPTSTSPCTTGLLVTDATYIYTCVATNTWHRTSNGATW